MRTQLEAHLLMQDSDLVEHRAVCHKAESFVEGQGVNLGVQMDLVESPARRFIDQPSQQLRSHTVSPVGGQNCEAANLTEGVEPPRANCVTVRRPRERMNADRVRGIPFFMLRDALFLDKDGAPDVHQPGAVREPGGG
ncbi:MAG TPA: hypothetical protein VE046_04240 [Steroidobacteraceae bacterium]|nr:hypothetical protein [Steroidobacteraceae bacterium]